MKYSTLLFVVFICALVVCCGKKKGMAQIRANDTLDFYFERANNDSLALKLRYEYAKKAEAIVMKEPNDSMGRVNYFKLANRYWNMGDLKNYKIIVHNILNDPIIHKDSISLGKVFNYYGEYCEKKYLLDSAYLLFDKAEDIYRTINDKQNLAKTLFNKSRIQFREKDFTTCEITLIRVLEILRVEDNKDLRCSAYNLLGGIYSGLHDFSKALEFYGKALDITRNEFFDNNGLLHSMTLSNIGLVFQEQDKHSFAITYFEKALKTPKLKELNPEGYVTILSNLGYSRLKINNYENIPDILLEALNISDSLGIQSIAISSKINLSRYYGDKKRDNSLAFAYATDAYFLAKKCKLPDKILKSLKRLLEVNSRDVRKYTKEYFALEESIQLTERKTRNKFARIEFETEELALENNKLNGQKNTILYTSSCLLLLLLSAFLFWYQKAKSRELHFVKAQQEASEEIYKLILDQHQKLEEGKHFEKTRIAKELHDGVMGRLSSIRLNLFVLERKTDAQTLSKCIEHIKEIQDVEKEIKSIAYDLGNNLFSENISFETVVRKLFTAIENHSDIQFTLSIDPSVDWEVFANTSKIQVYRILQEALQNIDKYAEARNVSVSILKVDTNLEILISDDGVGFEKKKIKRGFGIGNMKQRARELGGKLVVRSKKGSGTVLFLVVPLKL